MPTIRNPTAPPANAGSSELPAGSTFDATELGVGEDRFYH